VVATTASTVAYVGIVEVIALRVGFRITLANAFTGAVCSGPGTAARGHVDAIATSDISGLLVGDQVIGRARLNIAECVYAQGDTKQSADKTIPHCKILHKTNLKQQIATLARQNGTTPLIARYLSPATVVVTHRLHACMDNSVLQYHARSMS
jgi:hypothetical protein